MSSRIRVGIINYLNVRPFLFGLQNSPISQQTDLIETYPADLAYQLREGTVDLGIVPVAILPQMKEHYIVSDFCIGCEGSVASVCLFSEVPVDEIKTVWLDYQSRTSVKLVQVLLRDYWKINPVFKIAKGEEYRHYIKGDTAGVVIGDRAFEQRKQSAYFYDLGEIWKKHTGFGFVFAVWVANKTLPDAFIKAFNSALQFGLENIDTVVAQNPYHLYDLSEYYHNNISYHLNETKRQGLKTFLAKLEDLPEINTVS